LGVLEVVMIKGAFGSSGSSDDKSSENKTVFNHTFRVKVYLIISDCIDAVYFNCWLLGQ